MSNIRPIILCILDGWGVAESTRANAITAAQTPNFNKLISTYPSATLQAAGEAVGLSWGEMGNSEVGHFNIGAGRIIYQNLPRINKAIIEKSFKQNKAFLAAIKNAQDHNSTLHLIGLLSNGNIHASQDHLYALLELCQEQKFQRVFIHVILDGRDTTYNSGLGFVQELQTELAKIGFGQIATVAGRYYALDRNNSWDRTQKSYTAMTLGLADKYAADPVKAIEAAYNSHIYDEEIPPIVIQQAGKPVGLIRDRDSVIFYNFRADRTRQLTKAFVLPGFEKFNRPNYLRQLYFVTMTEYDKDLPVNIAFPPEKISTTLASVVSQAGLKQLHLAETEKYAHVTFFLNGGREEPFPNEERILIPSPSVSAYDATPQMSAWEITERLIRQLNTGQYALLIVNYANADMVAHTGNFKATVEAVEAIDQVLGELTKAILDVNGIMIVTGDHGNADELLNLQTGEIDKEHNGSPVPFILIAKEYAGRSQVKSAADLVKLPSAGVLSDIAPTILKLLGLTRPPEMTGRPLV